MEDIYIGYGLNDGLEDENISVFATLDECVDDIRSFYVRMVCGTFEKSEVDLTVVRTQLKLKGFYETGGINNGYTRKYVSAHKLYKDKKWWFKVD